MKKVIIIIVFLVLSGCSKVNKYEPSADASASELLNMYMTAVFEINPEKMIAVMPDDIRVKYKNIYTKDYLEKYIIELKNTYGDDVKGTVIIEEEIETTKKEKMAIENYLSQFDNTVKPNKCYLINGSFLMEGIIKSENLDFSGRVARCSFEGKWRLVIS